MEEVGEDEEDNDSNDPLGGYLEGAEDDVICVGSGIAILNDEESVESKVGEEDVEGVEQFVHDVLADAVVLEHNEVLDEGDVHDHQVLDVRQHAHHFPSLSLQQTPQVH